MITEVSANERPRRRKNSNVADPMKVDRLPPHSIEAEQGALGCILLNPEKALPEAIEAFKGSGERFYDLRHRTIFETIMGMYDRKEHIDLITLQERLKSNQQLEAVGGLPYLASMPDAVPSASNLDYYLPIITERWLERHAIQTCTELVGRVYEESGQCDENGRPRIHCLIESAQTALLHLDQPGGKAMPTIKELMRGSIQTIEKLHEHGGAITGLPTGFIDFDKMTTGLHPGEMIVIAGRPSLGKTSLAMNIAEHVAVDHQTPVGVFSLEMTAEELSLRMLCSRARMNLRNIREGFMAERDFPKITNSAGRFCGSQLHIDDTSSMSILEFRAKARRMMQQHGIKLFIVDYLQMLEATDRKARKTEQIGEIAYGIKKLAKELKVPVIVISQLNREVDKDKRKPRMADLRESGDIEQAADLIGLLYKADPGNRKKHADAEEEDEGRQQEAIPVNLLIAKQRNGPTGDVHLTFLKSITRFESAAKISNDDIPDDSQGYIPYKD